MKKRIQLFALIATLVIFIGCSDDNNDSIDTSSNNDSQTSISGVASKGPINGGTVSAYKVINGTKGELLDTTTSAENGSYSINFMGYSGPVIIEVNGGSYTDEATKVQKSLSTTLRAALPETNKIVHASITPLTEIAVLKAEKGELTKDSIQKSNDMVSQLIGSADILNTAPVEITSEDACKNASPEQIDYSLMLAAFSKMTENSHEDIDDIIKKIEADLNDQKLDETGVVLSDALENFASDTEKNKSGSNADELVDVIDHIKVTGIAIEGTISEAKEMLVDILTADVNTENPDEVTAFKNQINRYIDYMESYVPESAEAHLMKGIAYFADVINSPALSFIWEGYNASIGQTSDQITEYAMDNILKYEDYEKRLKDILHEYENTFQKIDNELSHAENVDTFSLTLTGYDAVYFDTIDVKFMRAFLNWAEAFCLYFQAIDYSVDNWSVTNNGEPADIRDLEEIEFEQIMELINNNSALLNYIANYDTKLNGFRSSVKAGVNFFSSAVSKMEQLGNEGRKYRSDHLINIDYEFDFYYLKAINEKLLASMLNGFNNASAILNGVSSIGKDHSINIFDDGFAYFQQIKDIYANPYEPSQSHITLYDIVNGYHSPRSVFEEYISEISQNDEYMPYIEKEPVLFKSNITDIDSDNPIDVFKIPQTDITIDGDSNDWNGVKLLCSLPESKMSVKIAFDKNGSLCCYVFNSENNEYAQNFNLSINSEDSICIKYGYYGCYGYYYSDNYIEFSPHYNSNLKEKQTVRLNDKNVGIEAVFNVSAEIITKENYINSYYFSTYGYGEPSAWFQKPYIKFVLDQ